MAYDEELADRVHEELSTRAEVVSRRMFGGIAFMVNTHMACGVIREEVFVRVGRANHEDALARGAVAMEMAGRPMSGMVVVPHEALAEPDTLEEWLTWAVDVAGSEPPKPPRATR